MYEALGAAYTAINKITVWEHKKKVLVCLMILLGFDPFAPLVIKAKQ